MWDLTSKILNIALGLLTIYFYVENRKLRGFEIEKDIELKKLEIVELDRQYRRDFGELGGVRSYQFEINSDDLDDSRSKFLNKASRLKEELKYLEKLKKHRWIFSK